ncbi:unnamed protein product, partial [Brenthis ino]
MEVGVRIVGIILRILNFLLAPIYWLRLRNSQKVPPIKDKLLLQSVTDIIKSIKDGNISSEEVVSRFIARIQEVNPYINAVVDERYRAALDDARQVDRLISEARTKGEIEQLFAEKPLLGIPFTVKESCSLAGLSNAVGCLEHAGRRARGDGAAVRRARAAGALPLLVSNTPELCLGWETANLLRGRTRNPHRLAATPGGSSGGEAALLACGATPFSVASDIAGSIRIPAAFCGVYGHKPTPGIISIEGHIPTLSDENYARLLTVGPMARHAADLAPLLRALAAPAALAGLGDPVDMADLTGSIHTEQTYCVHVDAHRRKACTVHRVHADFLQHTLLNTYDRLVLLIRVLGLHKPQGNIHFIPPTFIPCPVL